MPAFYLCALTLLLLFANGSAGAQSGAAADPLFASDDLLDLRIEAPLDSLMSERSSEVELPGTLSWTDEAGASVSVSVAVRARGNYRRQRDVCPFAPLRLNVKKSEVRDTLFDNQDKLKLVTHCRNGITRYQQGLLREHLVYRMFNQITDLSFRVRLLQITYIDSDSQGREYVDYGFVIEHKDRLAERNALSLVEVPRTNVSRLDPAFTNLVSLFQYFIGNTDFSPIAGPKGEDCCHNATLFGASDATLLPIPYDFDMSGMVNADYATPNPRFGISDVRTRLYRGRCAFNEHVPASLARFTENRDQLYALVESDPYINKRTRREMQRFMNEFFDTIAKPKSVSRYITDKCVS